MRNILSNIYVGSSEDYARQNKDVNGLYFITDSTTKTQSIYKGETKLGGNFIIEATTPTEPEEGVIYYIENHNSTDKSFVGIYNGSAWIPFVDSAAFEDFLKKDLTNIDATGEEYLKALIYSETEYIRIAIQELDKVASNAITELNTRLKVIEEKLGIVTLE